MRRKRWGYAGVGILILLMAGMVMNLNLLIASFGGTAAGMLFDSSGSYMATLLFLGGSAVVSLEAAVSIRKLGGLRMSGIDADGSINNHMR